MSKKNTDKQISVDLASDEAKTLEKYCKDTGKEEKEVIKELVRKLPD
ncbi:CopG family transcriptional regulator [Nostoc sp. B(2019)]|nr:CopG family transcriptional regulator [Nostoc sp. B(2019)]